MKKKTVFFSFFSSPWCTSVGCQTSCLVLCKLTRSLSSKIDAVEPFLWHAVARQFEEAPVNYEANFHNCVCALSSGDALGLKNNFPISLFCERSCWKTVDKWFSAAVFNNFVSIQVSRALNQKLAGIILQCATQHARSWWSVSFGFMCHWAALIEMIQVFNVF